MCKNMLVNIIVKIIFKIRFDAHILKVYEAFLANFKKLLFLFEHANYIKEI